MARITLASEWFAKILKDYSDWRFAWVREAGQNSLDAGATAINVKVELVNGDTVISWNDNGSGMTRETLESRFMAVGGSLKPDGAAGGFGVAKLILAFAHKAYTIRTGNMLVSGTNDTYDIETLTETVRGLTLTTTIAGDYVRELTESARLWVSFTTAPRPVFFYLNGDHIPFMGSLGAPSNVQDWCAIHFVDNDKLEKGVRVRINGQYMFNCWSEFEKVILVELKGSSLNYLTSNRDGLQYQYRDKLNKLIGAMLKDPDMLEDTDADNIELYAGALGAAYGAEREVSDASHSAAASKQLSKAAPDNVAIHGSLVAREAMTLGGEVEPTERHDGATGEIERASVECGAPRYKVLGNDLVILNKTNKPIPDKYTVSGMRPMEWRLFERWTRIVAACAKTLGIRRTLRTGWIFSVKAQAAYKRNASVGSLVLLNPCKLENGEWRKAFDTSRESFYELVSLAVHELTHITHSYHDEEYASALTDNMAKILGNLTEINKAK
jgi:hypothetical protein